MICTVCGNDLHDCTCPDIDTRLASMKGSQYVMFRWCSNCDKHYARCRCQHPVWVRSDNGEPMNWNEAEQRWEFAGMQTLEDVIKKRGDKLFKG